MERKILAVGAHADDIELSMGGTLLKYHRNFGYVIGYVLCTDNASGQRIRLDADGLPHAEDLPAPEEKRIRQTEADEAARNCFHTRAIHLNYPQRHYRNLALERVELRYGAPPAFPDGGNVPSILTAYEDPGAIERVRGIIREFNPEVIITMGLADPNPEHICTGLLVRRAYASARNHDGYDGTLLHALTPAPMGIGAFYDAADTYIDTSAFFQAKLEAIAIHRSQKPVPEKLDLRDFDEGARFGCVTAEKFVVGALADVRTGECTVEIRKHRRACLEQRLGGLL